MSINLEKVQQNNSVESFLTALAVNAGLLAFQVSAFVVLKAKLERIYSPRSYLPPPDKRADELPKGPWRWLPVVLFSPLEEIIHKNGLDAYMFLRFLKLLIRIFAVFTFFTWAVLLPINTVNVVSGATGLDRFAWGNITGQGSGKRFAAHIILAYLLTFFVFFMIRREMLHFLHMRHQFLISKSHSHLAQARTVLITNVPDVLADEHELRSFANFVPGGVDRVWAYRDTKALNKLFVDRQKLCEKLEAASSKLLRLATIAWNARLKSHKKAQKAKDTEKSAGLEEDVAPLPPLTREFFDDLVPQAMRPRHRVGVYLLRKEVDTIEWCKEGISSLNKQIDEARANKVQGRFLGSAFIRCNLQMGAHVLAQCVSYHEPLAMYHKWLEANPKDIVWENLDDGAVETRTRFVISWAVTFGMVLAWGLPAAFIGSLSNIDEFCQKLRWLGWLCDAPRLVRGLVQGVLPPTLLALLFILLPFALRALAWYECVPRYSLISVSVYRRFFFFLLVHGFLIVTLTSGIIAAIRDILSEPGKTLQVLSKKLPDASTFFMTYMVTQGLSGSSSALIQLVPIVLYFLRKWFFDRTPRQAYAVTFLMPAADFGVILPPLSLLATIALAYSIISPIINGLALLTFCLFYVAWKFLLMQVMDQPAESETGGLYFPMAISNLFVGLYIEQVCLACLLFLKISIQQVSSLAGGICIIVLVVITAATQLVFEKSYAPITQYLPMSLATKKMAKRHEKQKQRAKNKLDGVTEEIIEEFDIFRRDRVKSIRRRLKPRSKRAKNNTAIDNATSDPSNTAAPVPAEARASASGATAEVVRKSSVDSQRSNSSRKSVKSKGSVESKRSRVPEFAAPAAALSSDEDSNEGDDSTDDEHAFDHPSLYRDQPWIWMPKDTLGLSEVLVKEFKEAGVGASDIGAVMDSEGIVEVSRNPPDEDWSGGHDH